jgi:signal transduction histidine kinase
MTENSERAAASTMPMLRLLPGSHLPIAIGYVAGYVALDWVSYVHPFAESGITPWNPQTGLSFALILIFGIEFIPWLFVAPLLADIVVRGSPLPYPVTSLVALAIGLGYAAAGALLHSKRVNLDRSLGSLHSLFWLMGVALVSIALVAVVHAVILAAFGILDPDDLMQASLRAFVGDVIGVAVFTPFLLIFVTRHRWPTISWEAISLLVSILAAIWIVFGIVGTYRLQMFYLLFIPIIWAAVRFGLEGVTAALVVTQVGLIAAIQLSAQGGSIDVTSYQALMVVLAVTGLSLGVLVDEQRKAQHRLRLQEEALNRVARLNTMGEFAGLIAHEINQPLTAIANYARLAKRAIEQNPADTTAASSAAGRAIEQTDRAAEVIRRLREFIRQGRTEKAPATADKLLADVQSFCRPLLERHDVRLETRAAADLPPLMVDALQIEQVIVNLVINSVEALSEAGRHDGRIVVEVEQIAPSQVRFNVRDNGPGFHLGVADDVPARFATTKPNGLGLGLSLARSIVEAHGGRLNIDTSPRGVTVSFLLPSEPDLLEETA